MTASLYCFQHGTYQCPLDHAPDEGPATVTLTDDELVRLESAVQSPYVSVQSAVERIVAARVDALTADLATAREQAREYRNRSEDMQRLASREQTRRLVAGQIIANVRALADEWWGRAAEARTPPTWREVCRDLRAALSAAPTGEGT